MNIYDPSAVKNINVGGLFIKQEAITAIPDNLTVETLHSGTVTSATIHSGYLSSNVASITNLNSDTITARTSNITNLNTHEVKTDDVFINQNGKLLMNNSEFVMFSGFTSSVRIANFTSLQTENDRYSFVTNKLIDNVKHEDNVFNSYPAIIFYNVNDQNRYPVLDIGIKPTSDGKSKAFILFKKLDPSLTALDSASYASITLNDEGAFELSTTENIRFMNESVTNTNAPSKGKVNLRDRVLAKTSSFTGNAQPAVRVLSTKFVKARKTLSGTNEEEEVGLCQIGYADDVDDDGVNTFIEQTKVLVTDNPDLPVRNFKDTLGIDNKYNYTNGVTISSENNLYNKIKNQVVDDEYVATYNNTTTLNNQTSLFVTTNTLHYDDKKFDNIKVLDMELQSASYLYKNYEKYEIALTGIYGTSGKYDSRFFIENNGCSFISDASGIPKQIRLGDPTNTGLTLGYSSTFDISCIESAILTADGYVAKPLIINQYGGDIYGFGNGCFANKFGIGRYPSYTLDVLGISRFNNFILNPPLNAKLNEDNFAIISEGITKSQSIVVSSDKRIKQDVELISDQEALEKLRLIEPKKYRYIAHPTQELVYGFIAQEVKEVLPDAIYTSSEFLPDILQNAKLLLENQKVKLTLPNEVDLNIKDVIRIDKQDCEILEKIDNLNYIVSYRNLKEQKECFVYGKKVYDFMNLKKDYLYALHFAATQEIDKKVTKYEKEIASLKNELAKEKRNVSRLENQMYEMNEKLFSLMQRLERLE